MFAFRQALAVVFEEVTARLFSLRVCVHIPYIIYLDVSSLCVVV